MSGWPEGDRRADEEGGEVEAADEDKEEERGRGEEKGEAEKEDDVEDAEEADDDEEGAGDEAVYDASSLSLLTMMRCSTTLQLRMVS